MRWRREACWELDVSGGSIVIHGLHDIDICNSGLFQFFTVIGNPANDHGSGSRLQPYAVLPAASIVLRCQRSRAALTADISATRQCRQL